MSAAAPSEEPRSIEAGADQRDQRQVSSDRPERGERGERRGRRRGRRGGRGGRDREAAAREPSGLTGASAAPHEGAAAEPSAGPTSNGAHEHHREPARESGESREAPARHEEPTAHVAHFEPTPPPAESQAPRETKPYVVWSSAPADKAASGGSRGPEE